MAAFRLREFALGLKFKKWVPLSVKRFLFHLFLKKKPKHQRFTIGDKAIDGIIASNEYGRYCIPANLDDCPIRDALVQGDVFEATTLAYIGQANIHGDIVHAGAYFGDFLPALSKFAGSSHKVWAFEPSPTFCDCAKVTIQMNKLSNVNLFNMALSSEPTSKWLTTVSDNQEKLGGMSHISEVANGEHTIPCDMVRLDDQISAPSKVGLIHFDLEGYEEQALSGAMRIISKHRPILILETLPSPQWIKRHLDPLGYVVMDKVDANYVLST